MNDQHGCFGFLPVYRVPLGRPPLIQHNTADHRAIGEKNIQVAIVDGFAEEITVWVAFVPLEDSLGCERVLDPLHQRGGFFKVFRSCLYQLHGLSSFRSGGLEHFDQFKVGRHHFKVNVDVAI